MSGPVMPGTKKGESKVARVVCWCGEREIQITQSNPNKDNGVLVYIFRMVCTRVEKRCDCDEMK